MIEKILVESFGLFQKREFALRESTVFYGPNEAGKTTLFDALFTRLCKVPKRGDYGRDIYQRYGDRMKAEILPKELEESFDVDEFKNLYSIRSGDILLNITSGSDWLETVKAGLFSGGMNPEELASDMERQASDSRTLKHNKDLEALEGKLAELEGRMKGLEASRNEYADLDRKRVELKQELDNVVSRAGVLQGEIERTEKALETEDKIARRKDLTATQLLIDKASTLREELKNSDCAQPEVLNAIAGLQQQTASLKETESASQAEINMVQEQCRKSEALQLECDKKIAAGQKTIPVAQSLIQQLRDYSGNFSKRMKKVIQWNIPLLVAGIIGALICVVLGVLVHWAFFIGIASALLIIPARQVKLSREHRSRRGGGTSHQGECAESSRS